MKDKELWFFIIAMGILGGLWIYLTYIR